MISVRTGHSSMYLGVDHIIIAESSRRSNVDGFLAKCGQVKREPTLSLRFEEQRVHGLEGDHVAVHFESEGLIHLQQNSIY